MELLQISAAGRVLARFTFRQCVVYPEELSDLYCTLLRQLLRQLRRDPNVIEISGPVLAGQSLAGSYY